MTRKKNSVSNIARRFFAVLRRHLFLVSIIVSVLFLLLLVLLKPERKRYFVSLLPEKEAAIQFIIIAGLIIAIFIIFLWKVLLRHLIPQTFEEKKDFILMVTQVIGGVTLLIGLFFTWQNISSAQETSTRTFNHSIQTMSAERFAKAVDLLGNQETTVRVAGAYSLGSFANDRKSDYYELTIRLLAAFIRENSKPRKNGNIGQDEKISGDIQAALEIIGWRKCKWRDGESKRLDLSYAYLRGADLKRGAEPEVAHLEGALLNYADLKDAIFREVNLEGAALAYADLRKANFYGANLENASLLEADLEGADLQEVKGLTVEQIKEARNWDKAVFSPDFETALRSSE